jgi:hypothetical protein
MVQSDRVSFEEKSSVVVDAGLDIVPETADCIGTASLAMAHLADIYFAFVLHLSFHFRSGRSDIGKFVL